MGINIKNVKRINSNGVISSKKRSSEHNDDILVNNDRATSVPLISTKRANTISISTSRIDPKITFLVLAVVIAFFICQFPYFIVTILSVKHATSLFHTLKLFSDLLACVSCSVNFLIYCVFGQKFRETANEILFPRKAFRLKNMVNLAPIKRNHSGGQCKLHNV